MDLIRQSSSVVVDDDNLRLAGKQDPVSEVPIGRKIGLDRKQSVVIREDIWDEPVASPALVTRWCPMCGAEMTGKQKTCSGRCRTKKFRWNRARLNVATVETQQSLFPVFGTTEGVADTASKR